MSKDKKEKIAAASSSTDEVASKQTGNGKGRKSGETKAVDAAQAKKTLVRRDLRPS